MRDSWAIAPAPGSYDIRLSEVVQQFGYPSLSPDQDILIRASIEGKDILGVLPTGGGKSACYQIPGIVTKAWTLVISPLIALQENQVSALRKLGVKAFALHSGLSDARKTAVHFYFKTAAKNEACFLYISPELLLSEKFYEQFAHVQFDRIAVDEAHCVSTWGNSFRPDYQRILVAAERFKISHCSAFTATIDVRIEADIRKRLPLDADCVSVHASPLRPNLDLKVEQMLGEEVTGLKTGAEKTHRILQLLKRQKEAGGVIIYCTARETAHDLCKRLARQPLVRQWGYSPYLFHALLPYEDKVAALEAFLKLPRPIVVATSAFGMGVDRADVRQIIHYTTPYSLVDYAQQFGRGGRDGLPALCTAFSSSEELDRNLKQVEWENPDIDFVELVHSWLLRAVERLPETERRSYNLQKFLNHSTHRIEASEKVKRKERYIRRVHTSVALLRRANVISEERGFRVFPLDRASASFERLLELTQMHARMEHREKERLTEFFGSEAPTQQLLWEILARK